MFIDGNSFRPSGVERPSSTFHFVEQFILDRTLTPAIETFGFRVVRMIDPTCGSGHFMLGGFARLYRLWLEAEPGEAPAVLAQRALDQVFGVDLNPNVVAIARFRLLLAALRATGTMQLRHAFNFRINVATGDSLLHGRRFRAHEMDFGVQRAFDTEERTSDQLAKRFVLCSESEANRQSRVIQPKGLFGEQSVPRSIIRIA